MSDEINKETLKEGLRQFAENTVFVNGRLLIEQSTDILIKKDKEIRQLKKCIEVLKKKTKLVKVTRSINRQLEEREIKTFKELEDKYLEVKSLYEEVLPCVYELQSLKETSEIKLQSSKETLSLQLQLNEQKYLTTIASIEKENSILKEENETLKKELEKFVSVNKGLILESDFLEDCNKFNDENGCDYDIVQTSKTAHSGDFVFNNKLTRFGIMVDTKNYPNRSVDKIQIDKLKSDMTNEKLSKFNIRVGLLISTGSITGKKNWEVETIKTENGDLYIGYVCNYKSEDVKSVFAFMNIISNTIYCNEKESDGLEELKSKSLLLAKSCISNRDIVERLYNSYGEPYKVAIDVTNILDEDNKPKKMTEQERIGGLSEEELLEEIESLTLDNLYKTKHYEVYRPTRNSRHTRFHSFFIQDKKIHYFKSTRKALDEVLNEGQVTIIKTLETPEKIDPVTEERKRQKELEAERKRIVREEKAKAKAMGMTYNKYLEFIKNEQENKDKEDIA